MKIWGDAFTEIHEVFIPGSRGSAFDLQALDANAEPATIVARAHRCTAPTRGDPLTPEVRGLLPAPISDEKGPKRREAYPKTGHPGARGCLWALGGSIFSTPCSKKSTARNPLRHLELRAFCPLGGLGLV